MLILFVPFIILYVSSVKQVIIVSCKENDDSFLHNSYEAHAILLNSQSLVYVPVDYIHFGLGPCRSMLSLTRPYRGILVSLQRGQKIVALTIFYCQTCRMIVSSIKRNKIRRIKSSCNSKYEINKTSS